MENALHLKGSSNMMCVVPDANAGSWMTLKVGVLNQQHTNDVWSWVKSDHTWHLLHLAMVNLHEHRKYIIYFQYVHSLALSWGSRSVFFDYLLPYIYSGSLMISLIISLVWLYILLHIRQQNIIPMNEIWYFVNGLIKGLIKLVTQQKNCWSP